MKKIPEMTRQVQPFHPLVFGKITVLPIKIIQSQLHIGAKPAQVGVMLMYLLVVGATVEMTLGSLLIINHINAEQNENEISKFNNSIQRKLE